MDLSAFTRAGLKQKEISSIVGVSQTTVGMWMRGQRRVHYLLESKIEPYIDAITKAVDAGDLPLSAAIPRGERQEKIETLVDKYLD